MAISSSLPALAGAVVVVASLAAPISSAPEARPAIDLTDGPEGFIPPRLHPEGAELETRELASGVYALVSTKPGADNSGFVIGENGVLVIDSHINGAMAAKIQTAITTITDKPILYLVNTNYHGDHTFGNHAFPAATLIVAHHETARKMADLEHEKQFILATINNDTSVVADARLRLPDIQFDRHLSLDLGGRTVEIYNFGPGNTVGDTVVYEPESRVAWTGNLVVGEGTIPLLLEGRAARYAHTLARFAETLSVATIIPGHGRPTTGAILGRYMGYLGDLVHRVGAAVGAGHDLDRTLAETTLAEHYLPPADVPAGSPPARFRKFLIGFHRLNVLQTYRDFTVPEDRH
ncbi:MAG: MBL fold metallo-hydrolase [Alphaproteobacteria bacterium]|mgnify:CR=1 FL=1|nr:MBL fold metallo-hydrolase [Alphaproteobacteria bacterium]MDP6517586.1 MBL fold metallo-hydrolase [Alphaproteobacteria bacterium]